MPAVNRISKLSSFAVLRSSPLTVILSTVPLFCVISTTASPSVSVVIALSIIAPIELSVLTKRTPLTIFLNSSPLSTV